MRASTTWWLACVLVGCAFDDGSSPSTSGIDVAPTSSESGSEASSSSDGDSEADGSSSSEGGSSEPSYPPPSPVGELGDCPDGFLGPITFDGTGWGCIPACDAGGECPAAGSGDAPGECATNPLSSATTCVDSTDCEVEGEMCGNAGMNRMACLLPPSHCILRCENGEACPDEMTCALGVGICQYVP